MFLTMKTIVINMLPMRTVLVAKRAEWGLMKRFCFGAANRPGFKRPGVPYGQLASGAPRPERDVELLGELVPEMFTENTPTPTVRTTPIRDLVPGRQVGQTTIDLTSD